MSNSPTVATFSRSFNAWTGPAWAAAAAAGARRAVVELVFLAFPVLPLLTMMKPIHRDENHHPYMRAAPSLCRSDVQSRPIGIKGDGVHTTIDPPLPPLP